MDIKLHSISKVLPKSEDLDSVKHSKKNNQRRAFDVLFEAYRHWANMSRFREERERNKRYTFGDQWGDRIKTPEGEWMTEAEYIKRQGSVPLKNNHLGRLMRSTVGVYRSQMKEPTCTARDRDEQKLGETMSIILQCNWQQNRMSGLNARSFKEFLISGFVAHRKWYGWRNDRIDCWTDEVQPNNLIIDSNMRDPRGWDCQFIGEIHDVSFAAICEKFAKTPQDFDRLSEIYAAAKNKSMVDSVYSNFGFPEMGHTDFAFPKDDSKCRIIEVWKKERKPRYRCIDPNNGDVFKVEEEDKPDLVDAVNQERIARGTRAGMPVEEIPVIRAEWFIDDYWYYYFLSPFGDILDEGETPYEHKSHPYVFKAYPFIDGEIHSFISEVIDQQRYVNRLITLYDWIMRSSAKGVLLFPEDARPDSMSVEDIADEWSRFDGMIMYKAKPGVAIPQQIANNSTNIGIGELLNLQLQFFEDISGVNGALKGKPGYSGTSAAKYNQETQNATLSLLDVLDTFSEFVVDSAYKDVKNMQQYYDSKRVFNIAGKTGVQVEYDPQKIRDVEFDLSIVESQATPAYRQLANDFLMQIWSAGQISLEQLLEYGDFPFGDDLLQNIKSQQQQLQQGQVPEGISPELMQRVQGAADMTAVNRASQMLKR